MAEGTVPSYFVSKGLAYYIYWDVEAGVYRPGSDVDMLMMKNALEFKNFHVELFKNLSKNELYAELDKISERDMNEYDALWIIMVTLRTEDDHLMGKCGERLLARSIVERFVKQEYENLEGKPKLFLFQAALSLGFDGEFDRSSYTKHSNQGFILKEDMIVVNSAYRGREVTINSHYCYLEYLSRILGGPKRTWFYGMLLSLGQEINDDDESNSPEIISTITNYIHFSVKFLEVEFSLRREFSLYFSAENCTASIFNYYNYPGWERQGSRKDVQSLKDAMKAWNIPVLNDEEDLPLGLFESKLREVFNRGTVETPNITFLMSHGEGNKMLLHDGTEFDLRRLNDLIPDDKMNIVIVQMCRTAPNISSSGPSNKDLVGVHTTFEDEATESFPLLRKNLLIFWSTYYGDASHRHYEDGGYFIQELCRSMSIVREEAAVERPNINILEICILTSHFMKNYKFRGDRRMIPVINSSFGSKSKLLPDEDSSQLEAIQFSS